MTRTNLHSRCELCGTKAPELIRLQGSDHCPDCARAESGTPWPSVAFWAALAGLVPITARVFALM